MPKRRDPTIKPDNTNLSDNTDSDIKTIKPGKSTDRFVKFLILVIIVIIALILSITISFLTYRFMDRGNRTRQFPVLSEQYNTVLPEYAIWTFLADEGYDLRTQTADPERYTVSAKIKLGYDNSKYKELQNELTGKNDVLMDTIRFYFSQRTRDQIEDELAVKAELLSRINSLLSQGEIAQILFLQYQIMKF